MFLYYYYYLYLICFKHVLFLGGNTVKINAKIQYFQRECVSSSMIIKIHFYFNHFKSFKEKWKVMFIGNQMTYLDDRLPSETKINELILVYREYILNSDSVWKLPKEITWWDLEDFDLLYINSRTSPPTPPHPPQKFVPKIQAFFCYSNWTNLINKHVSFSRGHI